MAFLRKAFCFVCVVSAFCLHSPGASAEPQSGWWWNPNENGRGFFIEARNGLIYLAGYFYDSDGRATWLTSGGPLSDPYFYQGTLQSYRSGQTVFGPYRPPESAVDVGPVTLKFIDDSRGTITWPGGTVAIERLMFDVNDQIPAAFFGLLDPPFRPETGWWWNETESGTGFSVEVQGTRLFVVGFMYDDLGNPIWYFTAGPMDSPTHYEGDWLLFSGGQTLTGPYRPPSPPQTLGGVIIDFSSRDEGTIEFTESAAAKGGPPSKLSRQRNFRRTLLGSTPLWPYDAQWPKWMGGVVLRTTLTTATTRFEEAWTFGLTYVRQPPQAPGRTTYDLDPNGTVAFRYRFSDSETGCSEVGDLSIAGGLRGLLTVRDDLTYVGSVDLFPGLFVEIVGTCIDPSTGAVTHTSSRGDVSIDIEFGGSQLLGGLSRIIDFYPAYDYQAGRRVPAMRGAEPWRPDRDFSLEWVLVAP